MNNLSQGMIERLEALQERAFSLTDISLEQAIARTKTYHNPGNPKKMEAGNYDPQSQSPEFIYDTSIGWFHRWADATATKYDELPLMQRIWNIIPLCHDAYTQLFECEKIEIPVSTLPFMDLGGYACQFEDGSSAVLLNDGLLGSLPAFFHYLIPILSPQYFERKPDGNFTRRLIDLLLNLTQMHFSQIDDPKAMKLKYPSANDGWYLQHIMSLKLIGAEKYASKPNAIPMSDGQALYYACRGAYIFILAHEFAHIYEQHHTLTQMEDPPIIRDPNIMKSVLKEYRGTFEQYNIDMARLFDPWFGTYQPLEEQADALALQCVIYYIHKNELNEHQAECVMLGLAGLFFMMEITERFLLFNSYNKEGMNKIIQLPWQIRNIAVQGHHPAPLMRLALATMCPPIKDNPAMEEIRAIFYNMDQMFEPLWHAIEPALPDIQDEVDLRGVFGVDRSEIFDGSIKTTHLRTSFLDREDEIEALLRFNRG